MPRLCNVKIKNKFAKLSKMEKDLCINGDIQGKAKKISKIVIYSNDTDNSAKSDFVNKNDD